MPQNDDPKHDSTNDPRHDADGPTDAELQEIERELLLAFAIDHFGELQRVTERRWREERMLKLAEAGFIILHDTGARDGEGGKIIQVVPGPRLVENAAAQRRDPREATTHLVSDVARFTQYN